VEPVLAQFSSRRGKAIRAYEQYVLGHLGDGHQSEFYRVEDQRFLGSEGFSDSIERNAREKVEYIYDIPMGEIMTGVETCFGIPGGVIGGASRNRMGAWGRGIVSYPGRKLGRYPLSEMASSFGRDPASLCQGIARVEKRIREDDRFAHKIKDLEEDLTERRRR